MPATISRTLEAKEGLGPDHDGDADDKKVRVFASISAAPKGMGAAVDSKA